MLHGTTMMAAVLLAGVALGCSSGDARNSPSAVAAASATPPPANDPPPEAPPPPGSGELVMSGPVTIEQQIDVVALRAGVITSLNADVDSQVAAGQMLARLDDRQVAADRAAAQYKVQSLEADLKNRQAEVEIRKTDLERAQAMRQAGINTQEALDHARFDLEATQDEVERQSSEIEAAQAQLLSLTLELAKTRVTAPFSGVVSQRYVRLGQYVNIGDRLFQVTGNSPLEIRFTLPEKDVPLIRRGERIEVSLTPDFRAMATATVTRMSPVVDPGSGTIEVMAVLTHKLPGLLPGMVASVRVARGR